MESDLFPQNYANYCFCLLLISASDFFSPWGLEVLASEVLWIGFPCVVLVAVARVVRG